MSWYLVIIIKGGYLCPGTFFGRRSVSALLVCRALISPFILKASPWGRRVELVTSFGSADECLFALFPSDTALLAGLIMSTLSLWFVTEGNKHIQLSRWDGPSQNTTCSALWSNLRNSNQSNTSAADANMSTTRLPLGQMSKLLTTSLISCTHVMEPKRFQCIWRVNAPFHGAAWASCCSLLSWCPIPAGFCGRNEPTVP